MENRRVAAFPKASDRVSFAIPPEWRRDGEAYSEGEDGVRKSWMRGGGKAAKRLSKASEDNVYPEFSVDFS